MARRIWGKVGGRNAKQQMGRLQQTLALLAVLAAGIAVAALLGGSGYALNLVTGGTTDTNLSFLSVGPTIDSDQPDYNPGATVYLTGHNWAPGEAVHILVNDDKGQTWSYVDDIAADSNGDFTMHFTLPTSFVATYTATATGPISGTARTTFTDGNVKWTTPPNNNANVTETVFTAATNCTGAVKGGFPKTLNGTDTVGVGNTESLRLDAAATDGSGKPFSGWSPSTQANPYTVISGTNNRSICVAGFQSGTQNYIANYDQNAPTVAANNASVTVNEGVTASNTGTYSDADGDTTSISASVGTVTKTGTSSGTWSWSFNTTDGPAQSQTVTITADDGTRSSTTTFPLTVNNVAPAVTAGGSQSATEGTSKSFSIGSFTDPGADSPWAVDVFWGDGTPHTTFNATSTGALADQSHTYADNGTYTVSVKVTDKDGGTDTKTFTMTVANAPPSITAAANQSSNEGESHSFNLGSFSDPGTSDNPWSVDVNWGDGSSHTTFSQGTQGTLGAQSHTYADGPNTYTVSVKVTDKDGGTDTKTFTVTVANVAPAVTAPADQSSNEGASASFTLGSFTDPGANDGPWPVDVNWGDSSPHTTFTQPTQGALGSRSHTYADNGTYTVTVGVKDKDGDTGTKTFQVTVANVNPVVTPAANQSGNEGTSASFNLGSFTDAGVNDNPWAVDVNWGDASAHTSFSQGSQGSLGSQSHTYADNGNYTVTVKVTDKDGGIDTKTFTVAVANVAPTITAPTNQMTNEGASGSVDLGSFTDPGALDGPWLVSVDWGDGSAAETFSAGTRGPLGTRSHNYDDGHTTPYTVSVTVNDKDGGSDTKSFQVTVTNLAPTATLSNNGPVAEGSPATITFSSQHDASSVDTAAGFHYSYACDGNAASLATTYSGATDGATKQCTFDDGPSSHVVKARIFDKDSGFTEYQTTVVVNNVAPTAGLSNDGPTNEGSYATISFSGQLDPSSADTSAGFHYAYACDGNAATLPSTYAGALMAASATCLFPDGPATHPVVARIFDKDNGYTEYSTTVTVINANPQVTAAADQTADEGTSKSFNLGSFSDAGVDDHPWTIYVDWGDGSPAGSYIQNTQGTIPAESHTYADNGTYTVSVNVQDKDGGNQTKTFKITVANVAPVVAGQFDQSSNEGQSASFDLGSFTDKGVSDAPWSVDVNWGDGSADTTFSTSSQGSLGTKPHTYADNGSYTVTVKVKDKDNGEGSAQFSVAVANLAPQVSAPANQSGNEGMGTSFNLGSFSDAGVNDHPWSVDVDWGDGLPHATFTTGSQGSLGSQVHTYVDNGVYTVTVDVKDKDGASGQATFTVTVANVAPTVTPAAAQSADEGTAKSFSLGSFTDPGADNPWAVDVDWGDGSAHTTFTATSPGTLTAQPHTYADNGSYTVTVTVTDKDHASGSAQFAINVANVAPVVTAPADQGAIEGTPKSFDLGSFSDLGVNDGPWGVSVNWGDGSPSSAFMALSQGSLGQLSHTYADNNTYTVTVTVTDKDSGAGSASFKILVANANPVVTSGGNQSSDEGSAHDFNLGSFSDLGANDGAWSVDVDWGDGSPHTTGSRSAQGGLGTSSHTYDDNGPYHVTVTVTDKDGGSGSATFDVTVANVAPTADLGNNGPVDEASPATISFSNQHDPSSADTSAGFHYAYSCANGSLAAATYAGSGTNASATCSFDDGPSTHTVRARIIDKDGGYSEYTTVVTVNNVAPGATLSNDGPVDEGSLAAISFSGQHDPSSADTAAGFHYAFSCTNGDLSGATYAGSGTSASTDCTFNDNGSYPVKARIIDKDGGFSEYTTDVVARNVAPSVTAPANPSSDEGASKSFDLGSFSDPGADSPWKVHVDWGDGHSSDPADKTVTGSLGSASHTYDDSGTYQVTVTVTDKDGGSGSATFDVTVANVAPTADLGNNGPVDEASPATITFSNQHDPSSADTTAGFHYAFSCANGDLSGATYAGSGTSASTDCTFNDNGSYPVKARIIDKDGGYTEYTTTVTVNNVAPTATLSNNGPVNEASPTTISFSNQSDPSSTDTSAGFHYAYACDNGSLAGATYTGSGTSASTTCTYDDGPSTHTVRARIIDKDGGFTEYQTTVTVRNVAPTATLSNSGPINEGNSATITFSGQFDPSSTDTTAGFHYAYSCTNGDLSGATYSGSETSASTTCPFDDNGTYAVKARIIDKDGGYTEYTTGVTVNNLPPTVTAASGQTANEGASKAFDLGSFTDPGADSPWAVDVNWGDLTPHTTFNVMATGSLAAQSHAYDDNGPYSVTVTVKDKDGASDVKTFTVVVANVAPTASVSNNGPVYEGSAVTISFSGQSDASNADTTAGFHYTYACDGNAAALATTYAGAGMGPSATCTFDDNGSYTVRARIFDKDGDFSEYTTAVTVNNAKPVVAAPASQSSNEGSSTTFDLGSFSDAGVNDNPWTVDVDWGDGSAHTTLSQGVQGSLGSQPHTYADNGSYTVKVKVTDKDLGYSSATFTVTVANVNPTATLSNNGPINEGSSATVSFSGQFDPSSADTTAGFHYAFSCSNGDLSGATYAGAGTSASTNCTFNDNGSYPVKARIIDKDNGYSEYTTTVTVNNVAPTGTLNNNGPISEASPVTVSFSGQFDPSSADTSAGFRYAFSCTNGDLRGSTYAGSGSSASTTCTFDDGPSMPTVKARIIDKDGAFTEYTTVVMVNNANPTATISNNGPVNEGSPATISLSSPSDPSSADTSGGFHYAFACDNSSLNGATYAGSGTSASASCTFDDGPSTKTVRARIIDKDGGYSEYTTSVTVNNVKPTAALANNGPANEGSPATISFSGQSDPSSADTTAGFHYSYACDGLATSLASTYSGAGASTSTMCTFPDGPATKTVRARIFDKNDGYSEYTTVVTVNNVAPAVSNFTGTTTSLSGPLVFVPTTFSGTFADPGSDASWVATWSWDGTADPTATQSYGATGGFSQSHQFTTAGCNHMATVKITDKDGGSDTKTATVGVGTGAFLPPLTNQPVYNKLKNGQVLPVKIQITDCNGAGVNNLTPAIRLVSGDQTTIPDDTAVPITPPSVSNADTSGQMRSSGSDGSYIYNMSVNIPLNTDYTIMIYPNGTVASGAPTFRHVIQATK